MTRSRAGRREEAIEPAFVKPWATAGNVIDLFRDGIFSVNDRIGENSAAAACRNFALFLRYARPGKDPQDASMELFGDEELVGQFKTNYLAAAGDNVLERESRKRGGNAVMRQAKQIFSRSAMRLYKTLRLPDLEPFMKAPAFHAKKAFKVPLEMGTIARIGTAALDLRASNPPLYLTHLLYKHCGLRHSEIVASRKGWLAARPEGGGYITVAQTAENDTKGTRPEIRADGASPSAGAGWRCHG